MTMTISIPDEVAKELEKRASQRGDALQKYVESLVITSTADTNVFAQKVSPDEAWSRFQKVCEELRATTGPSMIQAVSDMRR